jgi:hypothetical protein
MTRGSHISWIVAVALLSATTAVAEPPQTMSYQGILTDAVGDPLTGPHDLDFHIYANEDGTGTPLWSESHVAVDVVDGLVNVTLGSINPMTGVFDDAALWLAISVDGGELLDPLTPITSVPWAFRAAIADSAVAVTPVPDGDWIVNGSNMHAGVSGNVGIGTSSPARKLQLDNGNAENGIRIVWGSSYTQVYGDIVRGTGQGLIINSNAGGGTWADINFQTNGTTRMYLTHDGKLGIGTSSPEERLHVVGTAKVGVLEITGADVAENFPVREALEPGEVVSIDPETPGALRRTTSAYDRRVAGVVSGAGDLPTGALLGNLPNAGRTEPVALSGRVWVKCVAVDGPIVAGDLLTTSAVPGHAMRVDDPARAQGAIIGKAMTGLTDPRGLVLVLVSLQ